VFFTDDDIKITPGNLYAKFQAECDSPYWGFVRDHKENVSSHFQFKFNESSVIQKLITNTYPTLLTCKVAVPTVSYCPGGGFYLRQDVLPLLASESDLFGPFPETNSELEYYKVNNVLEGLCAFDDLNVGVALHRHNIYPKSVQISDIVYWEGLVEE
jgi:hypothetical protein